MVYHAVTHTEPQCNSVSILTQNNEFRDFENLLKKANDFFFVFFNIPNFQMRNA